MWFVLNLRAKESRAVAGEKKAVAAEQFAKAEAGRAANAEAVAVQEGIGRQALAKSQLDLAEKEFERGKFVEAQKILEETPETFRDANWRFLRVHSRDFIKQLTFTAKGSVHRVQFLPPEIVSQSNVLEATSANSALSGQQIGDWIPVGGAHSTVFGNDSAGSRITFPASANELAVHEVATGKLVRRWTCEFGKISHVLLSPEGGTVLATVEPTHRLCNADGGATMEAAVPRRRPGLQPGRPDRPRSRGPGGAGVEDPLSPHAHRSRARHAENATCITPTRRPCNSTKPATGSRASAVTKPSSGDLRTTARSSPPFSGRDGEPA